MLVNPLKVNTLSCLKLGLSSLAWEQKKVLVDSVSFLLRMSGSHIINVSVCSVSINHCSLTCESAVSLAKLKKVPWDNLNENLLTKGHFYKVTKWFLKSILRDPWSYQYILTFITGGTKWRFCRWEHPYSFSFIYRQPARRHVLT